MSPLDGVRVVEISGQFTAVAGRLLAELGADVVVVEPPTGSPERRRPPFAGDAPDPDRSLRWWAGNVGKRSVRIDLGSDAGVSDLRDLVMAADLVIEGFGTALEELGVAAKDVRADRPSLIWVSVTPYGRESARNGEPVTDLTMLAASGQVAGCGYDDHTLPPIRGSGDQSVNIAGQYAAIGALVALVHRDQSGMGQLIDVNVSAACGVTTEQITYNWLLIGQICTRQTGRHAYYEPTAAVQVRCADGAYATTGVLPRSPGEFARLRQWLEELGIVDSLPEAVFLDLAAHRSDPIDLAAIGVDDEVTAMVGAAREAMSLIAASLPAREFFVQSQRRGFPTGAVLSPDEAFRDEHFAARGFRVEVEHPELEERYEYPGAPYVFSSSPTHIARRPPRLGEHDGEVLAGWTTP